MMQDPQARALSVAFLVGAIAEALAILPMLSPALARTLWGLSNQSASYHFAMSYGASLMLGWTGLLVWAYQKPIERKFVAVLTMLVIGGLMVSEVVAVLTGTISPWRMAPTWCLQVVLLILFANGYYYPVLRRKEAR